MNRRGVTSRRMELFQKADLARNFSTSFDEYVEAMDSLQVRVAVTQKTITYFTEDAKKGIRGKKLGTKYDKDGLISTFKDNDKMFSDRPNLKQKALDQISASSIGNNNSGLAVNLPTTDSNGKKQVPTKNYAAFTKSGRRKRQAPSAPSENSYGNTIPIADIKSARCSDIHSYCKKNQIETVLDKRGQRTLKGREHVVIDGTRWTNTKNSTVGSLIEFVALNDDSNFLSAVSKITGKSQLMLLNSGGDNGNRGKASFGISKEKRMSQKQANTTVSSFLKRQGIKPEIGRDLFKLKKVQVHRSGAVWMFPEDNNHSALEYTPSQDNGKHRLKKHGAFNAPFHTSVGSAKAATVFSDPLSYMKAKGSKSFQNSKIETDIVLMGVNDRSLDLFLGKNSHIKRLNFAVSGEHEQKNSISQFIDRRHSEYESHGISLNTIPIDGISKSHNKGINFF